MTTTPNRSGVSPSATNPQYLLDNENYRERAGRIIDPVISWTKSSQWHIPERFKIDRQTDRFKPYGATPGHGIELVRKIRQYALTPYKNPMVSAAAIKSPCGQGRADQAQAR